MAPTTLTTPTRGLADAVRLRSDPHPSRTTVLDGAWWPRSTDAVAELPSLVEALTGLRGGITYVLMNGTEWELPTHAGSPWAAGRRTSVGTPPRRPDWSPW